MQDNLKRRFDQLTAKMERLNHLWYEMEENLEKPVECYVCGCRDGTFLTRAGFTYCDRPCMEWHKKSIEQQMDEVIEPELEKVRNKIAERKEASE